MIHVDKVITRKEISVVFDDGNITAGHPKDSQHMLLPEGSSGHLFEYLHSETLDILAHPLVEDGAEKMTQGFRRHSTVVDAALFFWLRFDQGQKLHILSLELLEEPVNLGGMQDVLFMHHAQDVAGDPVLL